MSFKICHHHHDLPDDVQFHTSVAIDTETMGLQLHRDRLCLVQLSQGDGVCHVVQMNQNRLFQAPNLKKILTNPEILKIFHFARFDVAALYQYLKVLTQPIYCTKIASKLVRTFGDRHGLGDLCKELLSIDISKEQQMSDWGHEFLSQEQLKYAATDVLHLHKLKEILDQRLEREDRQVIARACFDFIPTCAKLDLISQNTLNVFEH